MNNEEAINKRCARRNYIDLEIENSKKKILLELINKYNKENDLNIEWIEDGSDAFNGLNKSYGFFNGVKSIIALKGNVKDKNLYEKLGYYGEFIVIEATKLDLGTCFVSGTYDKKNTIFKLKDGEELVCVITIGYVKEISFKEKLIKSFTSNKEVNISVFCESDRNIPNWLENGVKAMLKAPSARNRRPCKIKYIDNEVIIYISNEENAYYLDLGIAKANFELVCTGKFELGNNAIFKKKS